MKKSPDVREEVSQALGKALPKGWGRAFPTVWDTSSLPLGNALPGIL